MIFHSKIDLLQYFRFPNSVQHCKLSQFATSEFWVNFPELNIQYSLIFVFWISDRKLKINSIFGYWQFLKIEKKKIALTVGQNAIFENWKSKKIDLAVRYMDSSCIFCPFNCQLYCLIENWFLPHFSFQFYI